MIRKSFIFLERVGKRLEKNLWNNGIHDWDSFLKKEDIQGLSKPRKLYYDRKLMEARKHLFNANSSYFMNILPSSENWRLYDFFKEDAVFLDIETTGLSKNYDDITVFGLYDGISTKTMIQGINLNYHALKEELQKYKLIVTFNGASFDIPFIKKRYPGLIPNVPNFDVKSLTNKLGLSGGLKKIERELNINRKEIVQDFTGGDALTLWRMYRSTGDDYYLNLLVEYNEFDIVNLKSVAERCITNMKQKIISENNFNATSK